MIIVWSIIKIANPTVLEKPGALMIYPIYHLLFGEHKDSYDRFGNRVFEPSLELTEDQVAISYRTYESADTGDMQTILDHKLTPGIMIRKSTSIFMFPLFCMGTSNEVFKISH